MSDGGPDPYLLGLEGEPSAGPMVKAHIPKLARMNSIVCADRETSDPGVVAKDLLEGERTGRST